MKYFSLFSGIGGFELGIQKAVPTAVCVGYSEIDATAKAVYEYHFPEHHNYGDATRIVPGAIPHFDLLVAGFPCQSFSVAGKGRGFQDTRGTLFFEISRICADKRPRYILLENVKGLLGHQYGKTFQKILEILANAGYILQWETLNSKHYGVPQNRERVFVVGHTRGTPRPEVFPVRESYQTPDTNQPTVYCLDANYAKGASVIATQGGLGGKSGLYMLENSRIRRLTPLECERLQGFPDDWTLYGVKNGNITRNSDTSRYMCLGNAVTVPVVEYIARNLVKGHTNA
jgi:DNA (cytosine-5)-methyltransferase 1